MQLHLLGLQLHLARLHLHLGDLELRRMEAALRGQQFAGELLAIALRAFLHVAEVLAQVVELRRHRLDLVLQLRRAPPCARIRRRP